MNKIDFQIGQVVKARRESLAISVEDLAFDLDLAPEILAAIEQGAERLSAVHLRDVCTRLALTPREIFATVNLSAEGAEDLPPKLRLVRS